MRCATVNTKISIGEGVSAGVQEPVQRQIEYKLASMSATLQSLNAHLEKVRPGQQQPECFVCTMQARLVGGGVYRVETRGPRSDICVSDAASRLARTIKRNAR